MQSQKKKLILFMLVTIPVSSFASNAGEIPNNSSLLLQLTGGAAATAAVAAAGGDITPAMLMLTIITGGLTVSGTQNFLRKMRKENRAEAARIEEWNRQIQAAPRHSIEREQLRNLRSWESRGEKRPPYSTYFTCQPRYFAFKCFGIGCCGNDINFSDSEDE